MTEYSGSEEDPYGATIELKANRIKSDHTDRPTLGVETICDSPNFTTAIIAGII